MGLTIVNGLVKENGFAQTEGLSRDTGLTMVGPFTDVGDTLLWQEGAEDGFVYNETTGYRLLWSE